MITPITTPPHPDEQILDFIRAMRSAPHAPPEWAELEAEFIRRTTPGIFARLPAKAKAAG